MRQRSQAQALDLSRHPVYRRMLEEAVAGTTGGMCTGLPAFDEFVPRVMLPRRMLMIIGAGGAGKSAFARQIGRYQHRHGARVIVLAADKAGGDQWSRDFAADEGIGGDAQTIVEYLVQTYPRMMILDGMTIEEVIAQYVVGDGPVVFIVDSLPKAISSEVARGDNELAHIEANMRAFSGARAANAWLVVTAEGSGGKPKYVGTYPADVIVELEYDANSAKTRWKSHKPNPPLNGWLSIHYGQPIEETGAPPSKQRDNTKLNTKPNNTKPNGKCGANNLPIRTDAEIEADARAYLAEHPNCSVREITDARDAEGNRVVKGKTQRVREIAKSIIAEVSDV